MNSLAPEGSFCHDIVYKPSGISDRSVFATPCTNGYENTLPNSDHTLIRQFQENIHNFLQSKQP